MKTIPSVIFLSLGLLILISACMRKIKFAADFDGVKDRTWISEDFWAIPLEDWRIEGERLECVGNRNNMKVNILSSDLEGEGSFTLSLQMGLINQEFKNYSAGVRLAIKDETDSDYRSLCYFGDGIEIGIDPPNRFFIGESSANIPAGFDISSFVLQVTGTYEQNEASLNAKITDVTGLNATLELESDQNFDGMICLFSNNNSPTENRKTHCWFDNISLTGDQVSMHPEQKFGPVLWTMYTQSKGTLKMTVQMPPLSEEDPPEISLQKKEEDWVELGKSNIDPNSRIATFRLENMDPGLEFEYRVVCELDGKEHSYQGTIRREPENKKLVMGGMTCQFHYGFPYSPLVNNLKTLDPDMLYFSGDQIYEGNGGYNIIRFPADLAILNYLGKWYMFGWAFGDLMKDRPTITIPDDHEVYQGNLWGAGGKKLTPEEWAADQDATSGFVEPVDMLNVVMHTNTSHLPDPYDPTPMQNGIDVYYTDLVYGGVSFAIVGDRVFKSGPENISTWGGRKDHLHFLPDDPSILDKEGLKLLGDRQIEFLNHWIEDWKGSYMKTLLSQTIFTNAATHHGGNKEFLFGDLDSDGWPKSGRDRALRVIRKAFSFHIAGDQHLPTFIHYGIDNYEDAGWAFCTPAITVGYQRRFLPDRLGWEINSRPEHGNPNTGYYKDAFGNLNYVYAVGNPEDETSDPNRYRRAQKSASGFGLITFDTDNRTIKTDAYHFLASVPSESQPDQFPGWPVTVTQMDNYGRHHYGYLPVLVFDHFEDPVVRVINEDSRELVYNIRIKGNIFSPFIFKPGKYFVEYGDAGSESWNRTESLTVHQETTGDTLILR